ANLLNPQVSAAVAETLARALVQSSDERLATAREMRGALGLISQSGPGASAGKQPGKEIFISPIEEPEISITQFETIPNLESTFVGQALATIGFSHPAFLSDSA